MEVCEKSGFLYFNIFAKEIKVKISDIICITLSHFKKNIEITIEREFKSIPTSMEVVQNILKNFDFVTTKEGVIINKSKIKEIDCQRKIVILNNKFEFNVTRSDIRKIKYGDKKRFWWF